MYTWKYVKYNIIAIQSDKSDNKISSILHILITIYMYKVISSLMYLVNIPVNLYILSIFHVLIIMIVFTFFNIYVTFICCIVCVMVCVRELCGRPTISDESDVSL